MRCRSVELHTAAEEILRIDVAEHQVSVRHRRSSAAEPVAGRTGLGAGTLRADMQHPASVHPGDRAAPGADGADVNHRHLDRYTPFDLEGGGETLLAADHRRDIGGGAAHVDGDE